MWQSKEWNGQEAAFRMFTVVGIVLLIRGAARSLRINLSTGEH